MTHHHRHHRRHHHQMAFPPATCLKTTMSTERLRVQNPARFKVKHDRRERHSGFSMRSLLFIFAAIIPVHSSTLPRFTVEPTTDGPVKPGTTLTLTCAVESSRNSSTNLFWIVNGQQSSGSSWRRRGIEAAGGQLRISGFSPHHEGIYQCLAENHFGAVLSSEVRLESAVLTHLGSSKHTGINQVRMSALSGSTVFIGCPQVISRPPAGYEIFLNETRLQLNARHRLLPSGIFQISGLTLADQGSYKCVAHNSILGARLWVNNTTFIVQVSPSESTHKAINLTMTVANKNLTGTARQNLTLECAASGWPHVDIHWEKYGGHLSASKTFQDSGLLTILNAQKSDEGTYECTATAKEADKEIVLREAASVTIVEPPTAEILSPELQAVVEGSTITLKCKSSGSPRISYRWFFNGAQVTSEQFVTIRDSSLTMSNINRKQSGAYQCFASNSVGTAYSVIRLAVTRSRTEGSYEDDDDRVYEDWDSKTETSKLATARGDISITKPTASLEPDLSVRLSWNVLPKDQSNSGGFQFKVQMKNLDGSVGWETIRDSMPFNTRTYVVQRELLLPSKTYRFRICLSTPSRACINSPESIKVFVSPNYPNLDPPISPRKKPPQPTIVQAQVISCSKIEIGWQLPDYQLDDLDYGDAGYYDHDDDDNLDQLGEHEDEYLFPSKQRFSETQGQYSRSDKLRGVESFYVHYAPYQEQDKIQTLRVEEGTSRSATISNLRSSTAYMFKMQSVSYDGLESEYSNSIVKETIDCYNPQRQPFESQPDETEDYDPYTSHSRNPVKPSGGRNFSEFASQSLYVVGGVLFVIIVAALVIAMIVCLYKRKGKGSSDKSLQMNQTLMHCYQATQHQLGGHATTIGSSHLPSCNGHCTTVRTIGANSMQGVEYCRPMDLAESRALANQLQPCISSQNGKKPPPDLDLPPPPPLPPFQNSAYRGDTSHGEDALLYDQLSDPDERETIRKSSILMQTPFSTGGIYHPISQNNSPASTVCPGQAPQVTSLQCPSDEAQGNAYWVLENFSRTPSEGSGSAVSGGYYVTSVPGGLQSQPSSNAHPLNTGSSSSSSSSSSEAKNNRRQPTRQSPSVAFEPLVYRLARDSDTSDLGYSLT